MPLLRKAPPPVPAPPRLAPVRRLPVDGSGWDDAAVARALVEGQAVAASIAWDRYSGLVRGVLRRSIGPDADVEDAVQDVFLRFFSQIGNLRDPSALRPFLIGIALHVAGSELRRRRVRRFLRLTVDGTLPERAGDGDDDEARAALRRLYAILDRLDDDGRLVFVLRHIEGLELSEVAAALDTSLATVKRRLAKVTARVLAMIAREPALAEYVRHLPEEEGS
ncbi:RNA polymerase sigma factor RpoE [Minicystis rosea]|nr:RNA polymerase sigma factor RpoE [Minicystis rosea]